MKKTVYLAGPIAGLSYTGATDWREAAVRVLSAAGLHALSPMRYKYYLETETELDSREYDHPLSTPKGITTRDRNDVRTCDVLLVNLLGAERISIGTMMEVAWADAWRKPTIVVMEPTGNLHDHPMLRELTGFRVDTLEDAYALALAILDPQ